MKRRELLRLLGSAVPALAFEPSSVEAEGADPRKLTAADGTIIDLGAARQALLDQKAQELDRFARVRDELGNLNAAGSATRDARAVSP